MYIYVCIYICKIVDLLRNTHQCVMLLLFKCSSFQSVMKGIIASIGNVKHCRIMIAQKQRVKTPVHKAHSSFTSSSWTQDSGIEKKMELVPAPQNLRIDS